MAAPQFISNLLTIVEGQTITLSANNLEASAEAAASDIIFTINSLQGGAFVLNDVEVTEFSQEDIFGGAVQFRHDGLNSAPAYTVTARVGEEVSEASTPMVTFTPFNDAPIFSVNALAISEGETVTLTGENLQTTDEESAPEALTYEIISVASGTFQRVAGEETTPLGTGATFTQAEVNAGAIQFQHNGSEIAPSYRLRVLDSGIPEDPTPKGTTRDVITTFTPINDAPTLTVNTLTLTEGDTVVLTSDNLAATDVENNDAELLFTITAVSGGRFERLDEFGNVVDVLASPETEPIAFSQNEIFLQRVRFVNDPATDVPPAYTVQVSDLGDPPLTNTNSGEATVGFTAVNDLPVLTTLSLVIGDGQLVPLTSEILNVVDEETPPESLQYQVTGVENGRFVLLADGSTVETFTQGDINAGNVIGFEQNGVIAAPTFSLTVTDGENSVVVNSGDGITFQPVNDAPVVEVSTLTLEEGGSVVLSSADNLRAIDAETPPDGLRYTVTITNADPAKPDTFTVAGEVFAGPEVTFTQAQVDAGLVSFNHGGSDTAPNLTVTVTDTFNPDFGEPLTVPVPLEVNFTAFNDVPVVVVNRLEIGEGGTVILNANPDALNLVTTDEESPAEALTYTLDSSVNGDFQRFDPVQGVATETLVVGSTFTQADVDAGTIQFVHNGGEEAPSYSLTVTDTATTPDGQPNSVMTIVEIPEGGFTNVNDDPVLSVNTLAVTEGGTVTLGVENLAATDVDSADSRLAFEISEVVGGTFFLNGQPLGAGETFAISAISFGQLTFTDDGDEVSPSYSVTVRDPEGGASPAVAAEIVFTNVNDAPVLVTNTFTISEGQLLTLEAVNLAATDDETPATALTYTVSNVVGGGFFDFNATPVESFTQAQVNNGEILFQHDGGEAAPSFDITVSDGEASTDPTPGVIEFTSVNDAPTLETVQLSVTEGAAQILSVDNFVGSDPDTEAANLTFEVSDLAGGQFNLFEGGVVAAEAITSFSQSQLIAGQIQFVDDGDQLPPSFNLTLTDGEFTTAPVPVTITEFINVNDPPTAVDDGGEGFTTSEDAVLTTPDILENDGDDDPEDTISISQIAGIDVSQGEITVPSGALVSVTEDGRLNYNPNGAFDDLAPGESRLDTFEYTLSDSAGATDTATVEIVVTGVNDAPTLAANTLSLFKGQTVVISANNLLVNDPDTPLNEQVFTLSEVTGGEFQLNGEVTTTFSQQDIAQGLVSFIHDGGEAPPSYEVSVSDGLATTDPAAVTIDTFIPVSDIRGVFDYEQFLRFQVPTAEVAVPTDAVDGLLLAQFFDESFYLNQNPDVADAVNAGVFSSGYQHFVLSGLAEGRNPSLLYDEAFYLNNNPDVAQAVASGVFTSGLVHFLQAGHEEGRDPSALFRQRDYLTNNADVETAIESGAVQSSFDHFINFGANEDRLPPLYLYNEEFYLSSNPDVAAAVQTGFFTDGFAHFASIGQSEGRNPSSLFDQADYLAANPDIAAAVAGGTFSSGFQHYVAFGRFEERQVFI